MTRLTVYLFATALLTGIATAEIKPTALTGAWRITEKTSAGPNASTNTVLQPGLYLFTGNHYSIVAITSQTPRPRLPEDQTKATAAEFRASWGPFVANAGTYEVADGKLTLRPEVAKSPGMTALGVTSVYSFTTVGNTLILTSIGNEYGPDTNPTSTTLTRVE